ncbi:tetratricopeptide repeat protein [Vibrio kyushuensis]|uniref:tetratricopeptide repeat protein n=1 Tax=Vibrio TaxID=662 RepID=UPI003D0CC9D3
MRWKRVLCLMVCLFSTFVNASVYSSATLNEANNLLGIVPAQSKALTLNYLTQRKLMTDQNESPSAMNRDESDSTVRTPTSTIDALTILAQAEYNLGNITAANVRLAEAEQLATQYRLHYLKLSIKILNSRLSWLQTRNSQQTNQDIEDIQLKYSAIKHADQFARVIYYKIFMLKAEVASYDGHIELANQYFAKVKPYVDSLKSKSTYINYHIAVGQHYLNHKLYNRALSQLLIGYWQAIEDNSSGQLAAVNRLLAQLFYERKVFDIALRHLSQAADFYDNYQSSIVLADVLKQMGDIYFQQSKYNLALVHYFNVIDHERKINKIENVIDIRLSLAATYLQLYNFSLTEQYLNRAENLLEYANIPSLKAEALLLNAGLAHHKKEPVLVYAYANEALELGIELKDLSIQTQAYQLLYLGFEQKGNLAKALENLKQFNSLSRIQQQSLNLINEEAFRQQKEFVEQTLHLAGQKEELKETHDKFIKSRRISWALFALGVLVFIVLLRRGYVIQRLNLDNTALNDALFTHSRSTLPNLRMLNDKLPTSLAHSRHQFEQWQLGELINEPLNDRLKFVLIDLPFLRNMYLQHGYEDGLKLEASFGEFLKSKVVAPARIYHFSDANLLYIEPQGEDNKDPEQIFNKIQEWVKEFESEQEMMRIVRVGIADYPFLPRAYTAISDKELIDILLMSTSVARTLSMKEHSSQWVYLKAIENAPAASLATGNIRKACKHSINQGLIKVHSSYKNEDSIKKLLKDG